MKGGVQKETTARQSLIVIFNPFSPGKHNSQQEKTIFKLFGLGAKEKYSDSQHLLLGDVCYMEEDAKLQEYVLQDKGLLYRGSASDIVPYRWAFSQFDENILNIALKLMRENPTAKQNAVKSVKKRSSPVYCSRVLSAMVSHELIKMNYNTSFL